jgi:dolichol phosphate-mannose biosynthesis regulatory protein
MFSQTSPSSFPHPLITPPIRHQQANNWHPCARAPNQPFVDDDHILQNFFPPRVWAIRIPVIILLVGSAVVGSFIGMVMIRSNRKKAAKAKAAAAKKKAWKDSGGKMGEEEKLGGRGFGWMDLQVRVGRWVI